MTRVIEAAGRDGGAGTQGMPAMPEQTQHSLAYESALPVSGRKG